MAFLETSQFDQPAAVVKRQTERDCVVDEFTKLNESVLHILRVCVDASYSCFPVPVSASAYQEYEYAYSAKDEDL